MFVSLFLILLGCFCFCLQCTEEVPDEVTAGEEIGTLLGSIYHPRYCPSIDDIYSEFTNQEGSTIQNQGFTVQGAAAIATRASFNTLGGSVEFDVDASLSKNGVNVNAYTITPSNISPTGFSGNFGDPQPSMYCDSSGKAVDGVWCPGANYLTSNGGCGGEVNVNFNIEGEPGIIGWQGLYDKPTFHMRMIYTADGKLIVIRDGEYVGPTSDPSVWAVTKAYMEANGIVIYYSQWAGWEPLEAECGDISSGDLADSIYKISNLVIEGTVVQGPAPVECAAAAEPKCMWETGCTMGSCEPGSYCNIFQWWSQCQEYTNLPSDGCISTRNGHGSTAHWGCESDGDCCNPDAKCSVDKYCNLPCELLAAAWT